MVREKEIFIVPQGGIANRLRAIMSAFSLARNLRRPLTIIWVKNEELNASFSDIFQIKPDLYKLVEISQFTNLFRYSPPRKKNFFLPSLLQFCDSRHFIHQTGSNPEFPTKEEWLSDFNDKPVVIVSGSSFFDYDPAQINTIFPVSINVKNRIKEILGGKQPDLALHIRRTDNDLSIRYSPIEIFEETIEKEISNNKDVIIFLATDDEKVKNALLQKYPENLISNSTPATRKTADGITDGMAELEILSQCHTIYGSYWSSFSEIAAEKGNNTLIVLKKP